MKRLWLLSLSARRAWIEIKLDTWVAFAETVALRKESVDRNFQRKVIHAVFFGRSPQGERG